MVAVHEGTEGSGASVQALPWQVHTATAIGAGHVRAGHPNEDAVARQLLPPSGGPALLMVAVADGHGDSRHFRSELGAKMAVAAGISAMRDWSPDISGTPGEIAGSVQRTLVPGVVTRWNAAVAADLAENRLEAPERALLARLALPPQTAYGSTLLIGAFTGTYAVFAQIGDGNIVAVLPDGGWVNPVPGDSRLDGTHTTSLCQANAGAAFRAGVVPLTRQPLFAVLLATDGFGNAQADDPWQPGFAADLARLAADRDPAWFGSQVPGWAAQCASSAGSSDDTTIALVINSAVRPSGHRPGAVPYRERAAATAPARTLELSEPSPAVAGDPRRTEPSGEPAHRAVNGRRPGSRRRARALTAVVLVVLAGLALAFLLSGHGRSAPPRRAGPSASVTPSPGTTPSARATTPSAAASTPSARARPSASAGTPRASLAVRVG